MAVSTLNAVSLDLTSSSGAPPAAVNFHGDMDIDMDIELGDVEDFASMEAEIIATVRYVYSSLKSSSVESISNVKLTTMFRQKDSQVPANNGATRPFVPSSQAGTAELAPGKVHIRGLDNLHTRDIMAFASEHYPENAPVRIEWIDDTSANLVYNDPSIAEVALAALSSLDKDQLLSISELQLRLAKQSSAFPNAKLEVRLAVAQDRKLPGARERSRFYLFNPDQDPGERRRRDRDGERRDKSARSGDHGDYRRRRYDDLEHRRRRSLDGDDEVSFDVNLYDDDAGGSSMKQQASSPGSEKGGSRRTVRFSERDNRGRELFPDRTTRTNGFGLGSRHRSASPGREDDAGNQPMEMDDERLKQRRRHFRERSRSPRDWPSRRRGKEEYHRGQNTRMQSDSPSTDSLTQTQSGPRDVSAELRGNGLRDVSADLRGVVSALGSEAVEGGGGDRKRELFPRNMNGRPNYHRRSAAFDAADETADLFAGRMSVPFTDGANDRNKGDIRSGGRLKDLKMKTTIGMSRGILSNRLTPPLDLDRDGEPVEMEEDGKEDEENDEGDVTEAQFHIRGAAATVANNKAHNKSGIERDQGLSIRGAANATNTAPSSSSFSLGERGEGEMKIKGQGMLAGRELFPQKLGSGSAAVAGTVGGGGLHAGKELLFSDTLQGRGRRRRKAEDMFY